MVKKSIKKSLIKRNILQYLEIKGITKYAFYMKTGIARGTLDNESGITEDGITKFIAHYSDVNIAWLITGKGSMFESNYQVLAAEPEAKYKTCKSCAEKDELISSLKENVMLYKERVIMLKEDIKKLSLTGHKENVSKTA